MRWGEVGQPESRHGKEEIGDGDDVFSSPGRPVSVPSSSQFGKGQSTFP